MLARARSKLRGLAFVARNISAARRVHEIKSEQVQGFLFRGYSESDATAVSHLYKQLNAGTAFSPIQRGLYRHIGRRFLFIVEQRDAVGGSRIIGMNLYYLNKRDAQENTIHEGFIGTSQEARGRGIATQMRGMAIRHFQAAGFCGISTRVSINNVASLTSAMKIGFQPIEEYRDSSTGEQRYYMICKF